MIPYTNLTVFEETQYVETDEHPVQSQTISNSGMSLVQHDNLTKIVYLRFIVSCGSYNLMDKKTYSGKIKTVIKKLWID